MKHNVIISRLLPLLVLLQAGLAACHSIHDDDLPPCPYYLHFSYSYNMKYADAFAREMVNQQTAKQVILYIYDNDGKFITSHTIAGDELKTNKIQLKLEPGTYRLLAWGGLNETDYTWSTPKSGDSLDAWQMAVKTEPNVPVSRELSGLFQGQMTLTIPADKESDTEFPLVKNTNKLRLVLIDAAGNGATLDAADFSVAATTTNSDLDAHNNPVGTQTVSWLPYYKGVEKVSSSDGTTAYSAAVYELNTLRLLDGTPASLRLTHKGETSPFFDVDLCDFLLLTKMESHDIPAQEYLDRQDEYAILVYYRIDEAGKAHYLQIIVNDWTIRLDDIHLGERSAK